MAQQTRQANGGMRVLLVEERRDVDSRMEHLLIEAVQPRPQIVRAVTLAEALDALAADAFAAVLLQLDLSDMPVVEALGELVKAVPGVPVLGFTDTENQDLGMTAVRDGALDYFATEALSGRMLARSLRHAVDRACLEARLGETKRGYHSLFESAGTAMLLVSPEGVVRRVNPAAAALLGRERGEIEGRFTWSDFIVEEGVHRLAGLEWRERSFAPVEVSTRLLRRSGESMEVSVTAGRVPDSSDIIVQLRELSRPERAGSDVRRQGEYLRALFEHVPEGVATFDNQGLVVDVNPAFSRLFGFNREDIVGRSLIASIVPGRLKSDTGEALQSMLDGSPESGYSVPGAHLNVKNGRIEGLALSHVMRKRADGSEVAVSVVGAYVFADGERVGGIGIFQDVGVQREAQERLEEAFIDLVETTSSMIESVDPYTAGHQRRVGRLADLAGRRLNLDDDRLQGLYVGSLLHDVGKLSLPSTILTKPGALTKYEWNLVRTHPVRGYDILRDAKLPWDVAGMARWHHERQDGSGYPDGRKGEDLSVEVRILGVCDVVEAMSSDRPYRPARPAEEVLKELRDGADSKYDAGVVEAVIDIIVKGQFPLGVSYTSAG